MKFGKKLLAVVLAGVLALAMLTACGGSAGVAPQVPVDIEKGREIAAALNAVRTEEAKKNELGFDATISEDMAGYANAYLNWQAAMKAYDESQTDANQKKLNQAKAAYDAASNNLPTSAVGGDMRVENVARFDNAKNNGRNYFSGRDSNGNRYPLVECDGTTCAVTVVSNGDLTFAVLLVK